MKSRHSDAERTTDHFGRKALWSEPAKANIANYHEVKTAAGLDLNYMVVEKRAVIKFDKHITSRVFNPEELENLGSYSGPMILDSELRI